MTIALIKDGLIAETRDVLTTAEIDARVAQAVADKTAALNAEIAAINERLLTEPEAAGVAKREEMTFRLPEGFDEFVEVPSGATWEVGGGYANGAYTPPPPPPPPSTNPMDYPLTALEFDAALVRMGIDRDQVAPAIKTIFAADLNAMADSLARWYNLVTMTRDNPTMVLLKPVFNVTDAEIDAAWMATVARRSGA